MVRARVATEPTKNGLRGGPNSANEAKQLGSDKIPHKKANKKKQEQATSEMCWKVAETPFPKR